MRAIPSLLAIATVLAAAAPGWAANAAANNQTLGWPHFRGPNRDGIATEKDALAGLTADGPKQVWKASLGFGFTSIAVANGLAYSSGHKDGNDTIYAFDAATGKPAWSYSYPAELTPNMYEGGPNATPTVAGSAVYHLAKDGLVVCLDAKSGKEAWKKNIAQEVGGAKPDWGFSGSPTVIGNGLFLNIGHHGVCVDRQSGKVVWKSGGDKAGYASPIPVTGGKALLMFTGNSLSMVGATDGQLLWRHDWTTQYGVNSADPILIGTQVFIASGYEYGCALLDIGAAKPREIWRSKVMRNHFNACVAIDGHLYGFDESTFKCIEWATGTQKWENGSLGEGSLIAADGKLIILSEKGELVIANAAPGGFKELSRSQVLSGRCWTSPAIAGGRIYCRNAKGDLVCLSVK